ncbi:uncharacterized protein LOC116773615 [Danaus plexippus]|uniref:uncharacterized protein LOC116773615 n=1 Tax=Danaus plexippus TaxID=13037 RepID=UPI002AB23369|nr:uncharacterized protein LOC116773615 [Danaus plexippus]
MQVLLLFILSSSWDVLNAFYMNYEDEASKHRIRKFNQDLKPIMLSKNNQKYHTEPSKNFNCDEFSSYAINCTIDAAFIYNSTRMSPPSPTKINDWCRAIKHLTNCAIDWNTDCKDVTDSHFNEESIKGHIHVVNNICDDEWFLIRYEELEVCIEAASQPWEFCYLTFKNSVEEQKNITQEWTHYEVHFRLCCARARFRRCTLETLFTLPPECSHNHAVTLQKFSVVVSEGSVYQDCDHNMMYENCPGGDPRPSSAMLRRLMSADILSSASGRQYGSIITSLCVFILFVVIIQFV